MELTMDQSTSNKAQAQEQAPQFTVADLVGQLQKIDQTLPVLTPDGEHIINAYQSTFSSVVKGTSNEMPCAIVEAREDA